MTTDNTENSIQTSEAYAEDLSEQRQIRREKLKELQEAGRNPFLKENWDVTAHSKDIKDNFDAMEGVEVSIADQKLIVKDKQSCVEAKKSETGVRLERMD